MHILCLLVLQCLQPLGQGGIRYAPCSGYSSRPSHLCSSIPPCTRTGHFGQTYTLALVSGVGCGSFDTLGSDPSCCSHHYTGLQDNEHMGVCRSRYCSNLVCNFQCLWQGPCCQPSKHRLVDASGEKRREKRSTLRAVYKSWSRCLVSV